jgi:integrase
LRAANRPATTRENYLLAARQLAGFLAGRDVVGFVGRSVVEEDGELAAAAESPVSVGRGHVRWFLSWMIETRSAATAVNKFKGLQQFFRYLVLEGEMDVSPMVGIPQPVAPEKVVPVVEDPDLGRLLSTCAGVSFCDRRDTALIRLFMDTGARLAEGTLIARGDVDLDGQVVLVRGKGGISVGFRLVRRRRWRWCGMGGFGRGMWVLSCRLCSCRFGVWRCRRTR